MLAKIFKATAYVAGTAIGAHVAAEAVDSCTVSIPRAARNVADLFLVEDDEDADERRKRNKKRRNRG